jgi:hypothetical protein
MRAKLPPRIMALTKVFTTIIRNLKPWGTSKFYHSISSGSPRLYT